MKSISPIEPFLKKQGVLILDGGLATELENYGHDLNHHLWSARILLNNPDEILRVHRSFLKAGADCIITASYQATIAGFVSEGLSVKKAKSLINKTVTIACDARDEFIQNNNTEKNRIRPIIAASIGPYGAFLANGSEYTGVYDISSEVLIRFHEPRWELLMQTDIDLFACESIPSLQEAEVLKRLLEDSPDKHSWISFTCRDDSHISDGTPIEECVMLFEDCPQIIAIGINCTAPKYILSLVKKIKRKMPHKNIVVYPNSGEDYDTLHKKWRGNSVKPDLYKAAVAWFNSGARLVGGCCRIGPEQIRTLRSKLLQIDIKDSGK